MGIVYKGNGNNVQTLPERL